MAQTPIGNTKIDFDDVQGDILQGLPKTYQSFLFFNLVDRGEFRSHFKGFIKEITTTTQAIAQQNQINQHKAGGHGGLLKLSGINVAFTYKALTDLGAFKDVGPDALNDLPFKQGQKSDAAALGDPIAGTNPDWDHIFLQSLDGVFLITGESLDTVHSRIKEIVQTFGTSITPLANIVGHVRPNIGGIKNRGHEHFGYLDGISQPAIVGFGDPSKQKNISTKPGVVLLGLDGDVQLGPTPPTPIQRPDWAINGSFLVFRKLRQFVPEFNKFISDNAVPGAPNGADLRGARFIGRWKNGAPLVLNPTAQPSIVNTNEINDFDYQTEDPQENLCPFSAHLRKTNPRAGFPHTLAPEQVENRRIIRQGIPYGPEVDQYEQNSQVTQHDRGLLFACYQSNITQGFEFVQKSWANSPPFPAQFDSNFTGTDKVTGFDPIIGQSGFTARETTDIEPKDGTAPVHLNLPSLFVQPRGGEYFFSPSITTLKGPIFSA